MDTRYKTSVVFVFGVLWPMKGLLLIWSTIDGFVMKLGRTQCSILDKM